MVKVSARGITRAASSRGPRRNASYGSAHLRPDAEEVRLGVTGAVGVQASRLAADEEGLLPILQQFRAANDQTSWTTARNAYSAWYASTQAVIDAATPLLASLGVQCT